MSLSNLRPGSWARHSLRTSKGAVNSWHLDSECRSGSSGSSDLPSKESQRVRWIQVKVMQQGEGYTQTCKKGPGDLG